MPEVQLPSIQKLSLIHETGVAHIQATTTGIEYAGGIAVGQASTSGTQTSAMAERAAPPQMHNVFYSFLLSFLLFGSTIWTGFAVIGGIAVIILIIQLRYNFAIWPGEHERWQKLYMCHRCGYIDLPG